VNLHDVEFDVNMKPKLYTQVIQDNVKKWLDKNNIEKYINVQFSGGQPQMGFNASNNTQTLILIETINHS
jgi:hypothetical protein